MKKYGVRDTASNVNGNGLFYGENLWFEHNDVDSRFGCDLINVAYKFAEYLHLRNTWKGVEVYEKVQQ